MLRKTVHLTAVRCEQLGNAGSAPRLKRRKTLPFGNQPTTRAAAPGTRTLKWTRRRRGDRIAFGMRNVIAKSSDVYIRLQYLLTDHNEPELVGNKIVHVEAARDNNEQVIGCKINGLGNNMHVSARSAKNCVQDDLADESRTCKYMSAQIVPASKKLTSPQELLCR